jgi:glutathione S-transferase
MIIIGMYDSPFVRRVAISMRLLKLPYEHRNWSVGKDFEKIREFNPLGRVPTLVLDNGEALAESSAILDYLDDLAGPERALLPATGMGRRCALACMALATGAADKAIAQIYEDVFRPAEKRHEPWLARCRAQTSLAITQLEQRYAAVAPAWLVADRLTQADITMACVWGFLNEALPAAVPSGAFPALSALAARCEAMPEFMAVKAQFFRPGPGA